MLDHGRKLDHFRSNAPVLGSNTSFPSRDPAAAYYAHLELQEAPKEFGLRRIWKAVMLLAVT